MRAARHRRAAQRVDNDKVCIRVFPTKGLDLLVKSAAQRLCCVEKIECGRSIRAEHPIKLLLQSLLIVLQKPLDAHIRQIGQLIDQIDRGNCVQDCFGGQGIQTLLQDAQRPYSLWSNVSRGISGMATRSAPESRQVRCRRTALRRICCMAGQRQAIKQ